MSNKQEGAAVPEKLWWTRHPNTGEGRALERPPLHWTSTVFIPQAKLAAAEADIKKIIEERDDAVAGLLSVNTRVRDENAELKARLERAMQFHHAVELLGTDDCHRCDNGRVTLYRTKSCLGCAASKNETKGDKE